MREIVGGYSCQTFSDLGLQQTRRWLGETDHSGNELAFDSILVTLANFESSALFTLLTSVSSTCMDRVGGTHLFRFP